MSEKTFWWRSALKSCHQKPCAARRNPLLRTLPQSLITRASATARSSGLLPRAAALKVANLAASQPDREVEKRGPAVSAAFDASGQPTKAAEGWARGCGITVDRAERMVTDKGEWLLYRASVKGESAEALLANMVATSLSKLPIPKLMRWGASDVQFVRPVHTVTLLLGETLIPATILGIASDRVIRGHRFMGEPEFTIDSADQYPQILRERGKVIADYEARKAMIKADAEAAAAKIGGKADMIESLLEEVTSLVEWPVVLTAKFEEKFLAVPSEALVYTMKGDQKYFPVYSADGKLLPNFIFVANIESKDPQQIIAGNEKVVRPRLADAEFFFNTDRKSVWKSTFRARIRCCSSSSWAPCAIKPTASNLWRAGLPVRLAPTLITQPARACSPSAT